MSNESDRGGGLSRWVRIGSALSLCVGLVVGLGLLAVFGEVIATFLLAGVLPVVLGLYGLAKTGTLPLRIGRDEPPEDVDVLEELKRRYAEGKIDDEELERKMAAVMDAERGGRSGATSRSVERELDQLRR